MMPRPPFSRHCLFPFLRSDTAAAVAFIFNSHLFYTFAVSPWPFPTLPSLPPALSSPFNFFQTPPPLPTTPHLRPPSPPPPRISYKSRNDK